MTTPNVRADLIASVRHTHQRLSDELAQVAPNRMTQPGLNGEWTVKDMLAHITWWEQHLLRRLRTGHDDLFSPYEDPRETTDRANARIYEANRDRSLDDVRVAFEASYEEVLAALEALPFESLTQADLYTAIGMDTFTHYVQHTSMLRSWLSELAAESQRQAPTLR